MINAFINTGRFQVPDRNALALFEKENQFQLSDWADEKKSAEMGKVLNADYIVQVIIMHDGEVNLLMARILDVKTASGLSAEVMEFTDQRDARGKMDDFVGKILQRIGGGQNPPPPGANTGKVYKIGDPGPAGGLVFYDKGTFSNGWRYLEAAPVETEFTAQWSANNQNISGTATGVGTGKRNTQTIIERLRQLGETNRAAQLCAGLDFGGYKDWFLPSKDELNLMYTNLKQKGLGGFSDKTYCSSSLSSFSATYYGPLTQDFNVNGKQYNSFGGSIFSVRAVRAF